MYSVVSLITAKQSIILNHQNFFVEMKSDCSEGHVVNDGFNELETN